MSRWHFENCKLAPNQSEKTIQQREELRQKCLVTFGPQNKKTNKKENDAWFMQACIDPHE